MAESFSVDPSEARALHRTLEAGFLLPTRWYADEAIYRAEVERIHRRAWHFAAHTGQLAAAGDLALCTIGGVPVVLTRGEDGAIRGFVNICRHRGHPVVAEEGNRHKLFCPYHGWTYGLDGTLQHVPREQEVDFNLADSGLVPVQTHVWGPTVWVNVDLEAAPFEVWMEGMPGFVAGRGLDLEACEHGLEHTREIGCNWKVFQDNTMECYHCPTAHPELAQILEMDPRKQAWFVGGRHWFHHRIPYRASARSGVNYEQKPGETLVYSYQWLFPSTYLQFSGKGFDIGTVTPLGVDRIAFRHINFTPKGTSPEVIEDGRRKLAADPTIWQDVGLCEAVQANHRTGAAPTGRRLKGSEMAVEHFLHVIIDMMTDPAPAQVRAAAE
jgi:choline monooxygenase